MQFIVNVVGFFLSFTCYCFADSCLASQNSLWFANGMLTSRESALTTLRNLKDKTEDNFVLYGNAYNENEFIALQLLEVLIQKNSSEEKLHWKWLSNFELAPQWFKNVAEAKLKKITQSQFDIDQDLGLQVAEYQRTLEEGLTVTTLSHSQGNFYTNESFEILEKSTPLFKMLKMVSVANPDSYVWNGGQYFTMFGDFITLVPRAMPANVKNHDKKFIGHFLNENYLSGSPTKDLIIKHLKKINSSQVSVLNDGFLDKSFTAFSKWLRIFEILNNKRPKLNKVQCLAINLFVFQANWPNESCENRSFKELKSFFTQQGLIYKSKLKSTFPQSLYGISQIDSGDINHNYDYDIIFSKHKTCKIDPITQQEMYLNGDFEKAMDFIKSPDFNILKNL
jgi:hypothetical protein